MAGWQHRIVGINARSGWWCWRTLPLPWCHTRGLSEQVRVTSSASSQISNTERDGLAVRSEDSGRTLTDCPTL
jgi:hypothetical protein